MNTKIASYSGWLGNGLNRSQSTESIYSVQGKETDVVQDTADTETYSDDALDTDVEYEPATEPEDGLSIPGLEDSSDQTDGDIIKTQVIEVSVPAESELADDEEIGSDDRDGELGMHDYWQCAQCGASNNNPLYRFCEKCYKVRKNFFPPMPKRKHKVKSPLNIQPLSQDSGVECAVNSIEVNTITTTFIDTEPQLSQSSIVDPFEGTSSTRFFKENYPESTTCAIKRRALSSLERKIIDNSDSDIDSEYEPAKKKAKSADRDVKPLIKTVSDPIITVDSLDDNVLKEKTEGSNDNMCITCVSEPKSGVFVHGRIAHICCCYKCAMKVWAKAKRCPVCNCRVSNVLKAVVM